MLTFAFKYYLAEITAILLLLHIKQRRVVVRLAFCVGLACFAVDGQGSERSVFFPALLPFSFSKVDGSPNQQKTDRSLLR